MSRMLLKDIIKSPRRRGVNGSELTDFSVSREIASLTVGSHTSVNKAQVWTCDGPRASDRAYFMMGRPIIAFFFLVRCCLFLG